MQGHVPVKKRPCLPPTPDSLPKSSGEEIKFESRSDIDTVRGNKQEVLLYGEKRCGRSMKLISAAPLLSCIDKRGEEGKTCVKKCAKKSSSFFGWEYILGQAALGTLLISQLQSSRIITTSYTWMFLRRAKPSTHDVSFMGHPRYSNGFTVLLIYKLKFLCRTGTLFAHKNVYP